MQLNTAIRPLPPLDLPRADVAVTSDSRGKVVGSATVTTPDGGRVEMQVHPGAGVSVVLRQPDGVTATLSYARNGTARVEVADPFGNSVAVDKNGFDLVVGGNWVRIGVDRSGKPVSVDGMLAGPGGTMIAFGKNATGGTLSAVIPAPGGGMVHLGFDTNGRPAVSGVVTTNNGTKIILETGADGRVTATASSPNVAVTRGLLPSGSCISVSATASVGGGKRVSGSVTANAIFPNGAVVKGIASVEPDGSFTGGLAVEWLL